jgi:hypothetical protein
MRLARSLVSICFIAAAASKPAGTLITSDPFDMNGIRFGAAGVYSWPVFAQDRIKTETSAAAIYLPGFGELHLAADTTVQFDLSAAVPSATLLSGQLGFSLSAGSRLRIIAGNRNARVNDSPGVVSKFGDTVHFTQGSASIPGVLPGGVPPPLPSAGQYLPPAVKGSAP